MSRSVDLFIQSTRPIDEFVVEMAAITELPLSPGEVPGTWALAADDVHAELRIHPYVDDGELVFERYQYALSCRVANGGRATDSAEARLLRRISELLRKGGVGTMLVHDLQFRDRGPTVEAGAAGEAGESGATEATAGGAAASPAEAS